MKLSRDWMMRATIKYALYVSALIFTMVHPTATRSEIALYEPFDYELGLNPSGIRDVWAGLSPIAIPILQVVSVGETGSLSLPGIRDEVGNAMLLEPGVSSRIVTSFPNTATATEPIYISFLVRVEELPEGGGAQIADFQLEGPNRIVGKVVLVPREEKVAVLFQSRDESTEPIGEPFELGETFLLCFELRPLLDDLTWYVRGWVLTEGTLEFTDPDAEALVEIDGVGPAADSLALNFVPGFELDGRARRTVIDDIIVSTTADEAAPFVVNLDDSWSLF